MFNYVSFFLKLFFFCISYLIMSILILFRENPYLCCIVFNNCSSCSFKYCMILFVVFICRFYCFFFILFLCYILCWAQSPSQLKSRPNNNKPTQACTAQRTQLPTVGPSCTEPICMQALLLCNPCSMYTFGCPPTSMLCIWPCNIHEIASVPLQSFMATINPQLLPLLLTQSITTLLLLRFRLMTLNFKKRKRFNQCQGSSRKGHSYMGW